MNVSGQHLITKVVIVIKYIKKRYCAEIITTNSIRTWIYLAAKHLSRNSPMPGSNFFCGKILEKFCQCWEFISATLVGCITWLCCSCLPSRNWHEFHMGKTFQIHHWHIGLQNTKISKNSGIMFNLSCGLYVSVEWDFLLVTVSSCHGFCILQKSWLIFVGVHKI